MQPHKHSLKAAESSIALSLLVAWLLVVEMHRSVKHLSHNGMKR
jgi:hypothetical protein